MNNEHCQNIKEFKAYIEGFQTGKSGRPPNAVEWAEIITELKSIPTEGFNSTPLLVTPTIGTPHSPVKLEEGALGTISRGRIIPKTFGNNR